MSFEASKNFAGPIPTTPRRRPLPASPPAARAERYTSSTPLAVLSRLSILERLVLLQIGCQLALLIPDVVGARVVVRGLSFGASLICLFAVRKQKKMSLHPAARAAACVMVLMGIELIHPLTNNIFSGVAQFALYAAILAPLAWVPRLEIGTIELRRAMTIIWLFHSASCAVAVLQMHFPGQFQPAVSSVVQSQGREYMESLKIQLANGAQVFRPMGLTDIPGGAAMSGMYAVLLSIGMLLTTPRPAVRILSIATLGVGLFCLYLSQVRSLLVMTLLSVLIAISMTWWRGLRKQAMTATYIGGAVLVLAFFWAVAVGGDAVTGRLSTLIEDDPGTVYYTNRGYFLEYTLEYLLPQYPLGAGLGRWGMMYVNFGTENDPERGMIWSEIMWTGWVIDGGAPMLIAYGSALGIACWIAFKLTRRRDELRGWAIVMFAYSIGGVALTFNCNLFVSQTGIEFWMLNAALFTAAVTEDRRRTQAMPALRRLR